MLILQNISYKHENSDVLFDNISFTVNNHEKIALIGHNGVGKSTLLKIIAGELKPSNGELKVSSEPYYIPQIFGQYNHFTIGEALRVHHKIDALGAILKGNVTEENLSVLNDDWTIEERCNNALKYWELHDLDLTQKIETLSGGQKTKVFLAGISIHEPEIVLLDEPSNHLDKAARELLYNFIVSANCSLIVVSHDRKLLHLLKTVCEMSKRGITTYGGNYDFYAEQKQIENNALNQDLQNKEKALRKAREKERETIERQQKLDARGKKKQEKSGVARIMMNTLRNNAENSSSKLKSIHVEKVDGISKELRDLRSALPDIDQMKFGFDHSALHKGKILFKANAINHAYKDQLLWKKDLDIEIVSGERIAVQGSNGSGKTTLIKIILGKTEAKTGTVYLAENQSVYIDQDYSLINNALNVYEQAQAFNISGLKEHEIKMRLNRFLFDKEYWDKPCLALSGGEKMRLMLCCLTINNQSPDMIILDEPTNNLDLQNVEILTTAINEYQGTLIVVSHDESFLEQINIERSIVLE
ncbi:ABC transporter ATP-binding protein [Flavobacterium aquidurense]|uniref:ABC-F family ATP-binding cassette domain-containing protein n=1 Tax=Flavobacterium aquidurense TaxID=362413 RepID=UPI000913D29B|nr:ABC-F family ATP-binding cassette domain-containing protein [Flavobacterium aquidurense]OXA70308.1 ABC transporter ATP-binding protein [Flavobacterium aquidurense]SHH32276.1 ATPase components of ABC transporters with duplicated ATPase domains [Flavobacterium frigidimaris]